MLNILNKLHKNLKMRDTIILEQNIVPSYNILKNNFIIKDEFGIFTQILFKDKVLVKQGFKIHISTCFEDYQNILDIVTKFSLDNRIIFKFISNKDYLKYNLSSNEKREFSGKFITLYPENYELFTWSVKKLFKLLINFNGPTILSDKRYKNSVVHYRYGLFVKTKNNLFDTPDGKKLFDERKAFYKLPYFVDEPFQFEVESPKFIGVKYHVKKALQYKNSGGVYLAIDEFGKTVVIKEARPYIFDNNIEVKNFKDKEKNFLINNNCESYFPKYIDSFEDCGHFFVVEEYIEGKTLLDYRGVFQNNHQKLHEIILLILKMVSELHEKNIVLGDISYKNIIVTNEEKIKFIDVEHSEYEVSIGDRNDICYKTIGFYDNKIFNSNKFKQDIIQLGYLFMSLICRANMLTTLDNTGEASIRFFNVIYKHLNIPCYIKDLIFTLLTNQNITLNEVISQVSNKIELNLKIFNENYFKIEDLEKSFKLCVRNNNIYYSNPNRIKRSKSLYGNIGIDFVYFGKNKFEQLIISDVITSDIDINDKCDISLISGLSKIYLYLQYHVDNNLDQNKIRKILLDELKKEIKSLDDIGLYNGVIGILYALLHTKNINDLNLKYTLENFINNKIIPLLNTEAYLYSLELKVGTKKWSYYVKSGASGFLKMLILYNQVFNTKKFDQLIKNIAFQLMTINYTQNATYDMGMSGIIDTLLDVYEYTNDVSYLLSANDKIKQINHYILKIDNDFCIPSIDLNTVGLDFGSGSAGVIYVYRRLKFLMKKENVDVFIT